MAQVAKRNTRRCPTHPGALLREDVIPATGRSKTEIAQLLGISRQHLTTYCASASRFPRPWRFGSASCLVTVQEFGCACKPSMIRGKPSVRRM